MVTIYVYFMASEAVISSVDPQIPDAMIRELQLPNGESLGLAVALLSSLHSTTRTLPPQALALSVFKINIGE